MGKLIQLLHDIYPHVKGDIVSLEQDAVAEIEAVAKKRGFDKAYDDVKAGAEKAATDVTDDTASTADEVSADVAAKAK